MVTLSLIVSRQPVRSVLNSQSSTPTLPTTHCHLPSVLSFCISPLFNPLRTLPSSVSCNPFVCHSYENCRVCANNSHSGTLSERISLTIRTNQLTPADYLASWLDVHATSNTFGVRKASHATKTTAVIALRSPRLLLCRHVSLVGQGSAPRLFHSHRARMG